MTGGRITLCDITSGLAIEPNRIPDGVVGDSTPVTFVAVGAEGAVTWGLLPPGRDPGDVMIEPPAWPSGRTLDDHDDGTATVSGTYSREDEERVSIYCWDTAGQVAVVSNIVSVTYREPPTIVIPEGGNGANAPVYSFELIGGPDANSWSFDPPLPASYSFTTSGNRCDVTITNDAWAGNVIATYLLGWSLPAAKYVTLYHQFNGR